MNKTTPILKYGYIIVFFVIILIGLVLFLVKALYLKGFWSEVFGNVGSALLIGCTLTFLQHIITKRIEDQRLIDLLKISSAIRESGLVDIKTDANRYNFENLIKSSTNFFAILNDGLRWTNNHEPMLKERFNRKDRKTEFYFVDPEGPFCVALSKKVGMSHKELQDKINKTIVTLVDSYNNSRKKGGLKIYYLKNYPTQALYYTEDKVIVTPYQTAGGRNIVPLYEYSFDNKKEHSIGFHLYNDLDNVRRESSLIFENGAFCK